MRKLFISAAIVAGLILSGGLSSFAAGDTKAGQSEMKGTTQDVTQISGQITKIKRDSFTLKDQMGKTHKIMPTEPSELAKLNVGDNVTVQLNKEGRAEAINKAETMQGGSQNKENQNPQNQNQGGQPESR
jgi:outer membrane murein-binding lipoprotein Lpp